MRLPSPVLARSGQLPVGESWSYEVKWDVFRAIVSTVTGFRVLSRQHWDMTSALPELAELPTGLVLDGELVAFRGGQPDFPRLCEPMLDGRPGIAVTYLIFDVLAAGGHSTMRNPLRERRALLEELELKARPGIRRPRSMTATPFGRSCATRGSRASSRSGWVRATGLESEPAG